MSIDPITLRNALGQFATGVCVITANPKGYAPFGMTVNSFASVSLDPALVLWSLRNDSECYAAFEAAGHYTVNVLSSEQQHLSNRYAKKDDHDLEAEHFYIGNSGTPIIRDALCSFECEIGPRYDGGDHIILLGKVLEITQKLDAEPLVFHGGKYAALA